MKLENRVVMFCPSKVCKGEKRIYVKIGNPPNDKSTGIYTCERCDNKVYRRGK